MKQPSGVTAAAILTLLASLALGFLTLVTTLVYFFIGFAPLPGYSSGLGAGALIYVLQVMWPYIALTLYAFSISIAMFITASKYVYYFAVTFWALLTIFFYFWSHSTWTNLANLLANSSANNYYGYLQIIASIIPLIYSIGCLAYFQTSRAKEYYRI